MSTAASPTTDFDTQKDQGFAFLRDQRYEDAETVFIGLLRACPEDPMAYLGLGHSYFGRKDIDTALLLYAQAARFDPDNPTIQASHAKAIALLAGAEDAQNLEQSPTGAVFSGIGTIPTDPESVASFLQGSQGDESEITEQEVVRASEILHAVISSPRPAMAVADHLDEIDSLLPALLELNIRQAVTDGRPDLASALQALLKNIHLQLESRESRVSKPPVLPALRSLPEIRRVLIFGLPDESAALRQHMTTEGLSALRCETTLHTQVPPGLLDGVDAVVAHNPHGSPRILQALAACAAANIPVVLDLDSDFEQMPVSHPHYDQVGLGTAERARAFNAALLLADQVCVSNEGLAAVIRGKGHRAEVIPDGWNPDNPLWDKPGPRRHHVNLGWIGSAGIGDDILMVRRMILRVMHEFPQVNLTIVGDHHAYQMFDNLPESRRLFLPAVRYEDYPYVLGQLDILLAPMRSTPFNQCQSDRLVMEAGVRRIPWVASPIPVYEDWEAGGMIADTLEDWHTHLRHLILDPDLRASLGQAGRKKAESRTAQRLANAWMETIARCAQRKQKENQV